MYVGYLNHKMLVNTFQAADLYITSIQDSRLMMLRQSCMTGTPVVAFKICNRRIL